MRDPKVTRRIMSAVPARNSRPELTLRKALHSRGYRYRIHRRDVFGTPDIVFVGRRVAVFVDGDFWHGTGWKARGFDSLEEQFATNRDFWVQKITKTQTRDAEVNRRLATEGWKVIRVLESEIASQLDTAVGRIAELLKAPPTDT